MSVKGVLDDAAAQATAGLRIDLKSAQRQADEHQALVRRRGRAALGSAVAVAAVALLAVLLPGGVFRASSQGPATGDTGPVGLPDHWYYAPPWTPPVTRQPMAAASMVLAVSQGVGAPTDLAPVLVSADGTQYASVPWEKGDSMLALASNGQYVGWVTQPAGDARKHRGSVIHRIRLRDGRQTDAQLPAGVQVAQIRWDSDQLMVNIQFIPGQIVPGFVLSAGSDALRRIEPPVELGPKDMSPVPESNESDRIVSSASMGDPTGRWWAGVSAVPVGERVAAKATFRLEVAEFLPTVRIRRFPIVGDAPITEARVLGWAEGGIVVRVHSDAPRGGRGISLRLFDPDTGSSRIISQRRGTFFRPVAVAVEVVGAGSTVPGVQPEFPSTDRRHLQFLVLQAWLRYKLELWGALLLGVVVLIGALIAVRRRSDRSAGRESAEPGLSERDFAGRGRAGEVLAAGADEVIRAEEEPE
jgi:hypothetical protein